MYVSQLEAYPALADFGKLVETLTIKSQTLTVPSSDDENNNLTVGLGSGAAVLAASEAKPEAEGRVSSVSAGVGAQSVDSGDQILT